MNPAVQCRVCMYVQDDSADNNRRVMQVDPVPLAELRSGWCPLSRHDSSWL